MPQNPSFEENKIPPYFTSSVIAGPAAKAIWGLRRNGTENLHKERCRSPNPIRAMLGPERSAAAHG